MSFLSLTDKKERDRIAKDYAGVTSRLKDKFQKEKIADAQAKEKLIQKTEPVTSAMTSVILGNPDDDESTEKAVVPALKKQTAELKKDNEALKKQQEIQHKELKKITNAVQNLPIDLSYVLDNKIDPEELELRSEGSDVILSPEVEKLRDDFLNEVYELQYDELKDDTRGVIQDIGFKLPIDLVPKSFSNRSEIKDVLLRANKLARKYGSGKRGSGESLNESGRRFDVMKKYIGILEKIIEKLDTFDVELDKILNKSGDTDSENDIITASQGGEGVHASKNAETTQIEKNYPISTYIYYSDPNELVERLELLVASKNAGNNGVLNEISAILDELLKHWDLSKDDYTSLNRNLVLGA